MVSIGSDGRMIRHRDVNRKGTEYLGTLERGLGRSR